MFASQSYETCILGTAEPGIEAAEPGCGMILVKSEQQRATAKGNPSLNP